MNILAHLYLSGKNNDLLVGNFIGDYVKGNEIYLYPQGIQAGIKLHREIDTFTDKNATFRSSKIFFRKFYGKYSGVITDIIYDHFLIQHWEKFSDINLQSFITETNIILNSHHKYFPEKVQLFFPNYVKNNWINLYSTYKGLYKILKGMGKRSSLPDQPDSAIHVLQENYNKLENQFLTFFPVLIEFVQDTKKRVYLI